MALKKNNSGENFIEIGSEYKWTINNFSSRSESVGQLIMSPTFCSGVSDYGSGMKWQMLLYPDGQIEKWKGCISIFLKSLNDFDVTVDLEICIKSTTVDYGSLKFSYTFKRIMPKDYGFPKFVDRARLLNDLKRGNDTLIIGWKISFANKSEPECNKYHNLVKDVGSLLEMREHCSDVILVSNDGTEHKAHKAILMCRSKVFSAMFQHDMKEKQDNTVNIQDIDAETLKSMLQFMYTGNVKNEDINVQDKAKKLSIAANKYELDDLKKMCMDSLSENMENDNILDLIEFANTYDFNELKLKAKKYFLRNYKEIVLIKGRKNMKDLSRYILEDLFYDLATYEKSETTESK